MNGHFLIGSINFVWIQHGYLPDPVSALDPNNSVIKRLCCSYFQCLDKDWDHTRSRPKVVKLFFMLNSAENGIWSAYKILNTRNSNFPPAQQN